MSIVRCQGYLYGNIKRFPRQIPRRKCIYSPKSINGSRETPARASDYEYLLWFNRICHSSFHLDRQAISSCRTLVLQTIHHRCFRKCSQLSTPHNEWANGPLRQLLQMPHIHRTTFENCYKNVFAYLAYSMQHTPLKWPTGSTKTKGIQFELIESTKIQFQMQQVAFRLPLL